MDKILIDEEVLEKALRLLAQFEAHYKVKARVAEIEQLKRWEEKKAKYEARAAEIDSVWMAVAEALDGSF